MLSSQKEMYSTAKKEDFALYFPWCNMADRLPLMLYANSNIGLI